MKAAILCSTLAIFFSLQNVTAKVPFIYHVPTSIVSPNPRAKSPILQTITMKVDNFNLQDERTYAMRYYANDQHFVAGGPIFINLGGKWEITAESIMEGQIFDMAEDHNGYLFYTEHRYYGQSFPTSDLTTANLKYLSVDQALADVAAFIRVLKKQSYFENSKVVVVGGSYAATMATWMRLKYPHLVDAAYASSAPLLALDDYKQFFEVVGKNIFLESQNCYNTIKAATLSMVELYKTQEERSYLSELFNTCTPLKDEFPYKDNFFNNIANIFGRTVQYAYPGLILNECNTLLNKSGIPVEQLASYVKDQYRGNCIADYDDTLYWFSQTELSTNFYRQWFYQMCSEFGFFQTGNSSEHPFGINWFSTFSHKLCEDTFGPEFNKISILNNIDEINRKYQALKPDVSKVVSIHGTVDPWHAIGLLEDLHEDAPVLLVQGTSHCADLSSISPSDSEEMRNAKQRAKDLIAKWIS